MEPELFKKKFDKLHNWLHNLSSPSVLKFELDLYKKLWNFFLIGESYYFIINHHALAIEFVSSEVENVMGYTTSEFDISLMNDKLHPDDRGWFLSLGAGMIIFFQQLPIEKLMKYKMRYDIRFMKKTGSMHASYIRLIA